MNKHRKESHFKNKTRSVQLKVRQLLSKKDFFRNEESHFLYTLLKNK